MNDVSAEIEELKTELASLARKLEEIASGSAQAANGGSHYSERYEHLKGRLKDKFGGAMDATRKTGRKVYDYAEENPWQIAAVLAVIGIAAGFLLRNPHNSGEQ